jgi:hypothetical protein
MRIVEHPYRRPLQRVDNYADFSELQLGSQILLKLSTLMVGYLIIISIVGMMDLGNPRIFVTYGKDRFGPSRYIH